MVSFPLAIGMTVCQVVALIVLSKCELSALRYEIASITCIAYLLGSILLSFVNMRLGSGNSGCCSLPVKVKSGNSQGVLIHVLGMTGQVSIIALLSGA